LLPMNAIFIANGLSEREPNVLRQKPLLSVYAGSGQMLALCFERLAARF
jgi:hypothetical protein